MKKQIYHEVPKGERTRKRSVIEPIMNCPECGEKPVFCRSYESYGYCMNAVPGIEKCGFKPKIERWTSFIFSVEEWNRAVMTYNHNKLLRKKQDYA